MHGDAGCAKRQEPRFLRDASCRSVAGTCFPCGPACGPSPPGSTGSAAVRPPRPPGRWPFGGQPIPPHRVSWTRTGSSPEGEHGTYPTRQWCGYGDPRGGGDQRRLADHQDAHRDLGAQGRASSVSARDLSRRSGPWARLSRVLCDALSWRISPGRRQGDRRRHAPRIGTSRPTARCMRRTQFASTKSLRCALGSPEVVGLESNEGRSRLPCSVLPPHRRGARSA
jgi:hypothetical protein